MRSSTRSNTTAPSPRPYARDETPWETLWLFAFLAAQPMLSAALFVWQGQTNLSAFLVVQVPFWFAWIALFPLVRVLQAYIAPRASISARILLQLGSAGGVIGAHFLALNLAMAPVSAALGRGWAPNFSLHPRRNAGLLFISLLVYTLIVTFIAANRHRRQSMEVRELAQRLQGQVSDARFRALRSRVNPHFLFNALNALAMLIRDERRTDAVRFLAGLSDLLRDAVDDARPAEVPLRDELAFTMKYLAVEQIRLDNTLSIDVDISSAVLDAYVPTLILQPLVENAIRHGIARREGAGRIAIEGRREGDLVHLLVGDDGGGLDPRSPRTGTGLQNIESRLRELYGDAQTFSLLAASDGPGVVARLALPFRASSAARVAT